MRTIWKFPLPADPMACVQIDMPKGATIRHFALQGIAPTMWAEVDAEAETEPRYFQMIGTGHPINAPSAYIGTWEMGPFVWHLYERLELEIPANLLPSLPTDEARAAYRTLIKGGYTLGSVPGGGWYWKAPSDESMTTEEMMAVAELQEHGFGSVVA